MSTSEQPVGGHDQSVAPSVRNRARKLRAAFAPAHLRALLRLRSARLSLALAGLLALYALLGFALAPFLLRTQLPKYVRKDLGCQLVLQDVRVQPFKLWVEFSGIHLRDRNGQPLLDAARFALDFRALTSLWTRSYVFAAIAIEQPQLRVAIRPDGSVNLSDLSSLRPEPGKPKSDGSLPGLWLQSFSLADGRIRFEDCARKTCFVREFEQLKLAVQNLRTTARGGEFELATQLSDGASLAWKGSIAVRPALGSAGRLVLSNVPLASVAEYLGDALPLGSLRGSAHLTTSYSVSLDKGVRMHAIIDGLGASDVQVRAKTPQGGGVDIAQIELSGGRIEMPRRDVSAASLLVRGLHTHARFGADGELNLRHLVSGGHAEPARDDSSPPWSIELADIELQDAAVELSHQAASVRFAPIGITVKDWSNDPRKPFSVATKIGIQGGGRFAAEGPVTLAPLGAELELDAAGLDLSLAQPYIQQQADFTLEGGTLALHGKLALRPAAPMLSFVGRVKLENLRTLDNEQHQDLFDFGSMELSGVHLQARPQQLEIERIDLREPYARVILRPDGTLNLKSALGPPKARPSRDSKAPNAALPASPQPAVTPAPAVVASAPAVVAVAAAAAATEPMPIRVRVLAIERMRMNFSDTLIRPHFALDLHKVNGAIRGISSDRGSSAVIALKGTLGDNAPVSIDGKLRPFAYDRHSDILIHADNISLPIFNPYSGRFAGYNIARGELSTEVHYKLENRKLEASHSIRVDQLKWGEATDTKEAAPLPVKLATVLLRDRNGVINLDLPLHGTLDDPSFSVWPLIWKVLGNICIKAVTAPFDMLASFFSGAQDAKFIDFDPGRAELATRSKTALDALSKALVDRQELTLDIPIATLPAIDRPGLLEYKLERQIQDALDRDASLRKTAQDFVSLDADDQIDLLRDLYKHRYDKKPSIPDAPKPPPQLSRADAKAAAKQFELGQLRQALRSKISVTDEELAQLGRQRGEAIERALASGGKLATSRILLSSEGEVSAEQGKIRLALKLK